MKRILIGVLFVVGIVAIGLGVTSLVYGQFAEDEVVAGSNPYPVPPTTVSPAYPGPVNDATAVALGTAMFSGVDTTVVALGTAMFSGVVPTPAVDCQTQVVDLSSGTFELTLSNPASIWFSADFGRNDLRSMLGPYILDPVEVHGQIINDFGLTNYELYNFSVSEARPGQEFSILPGTYTLSAQQVVRDYLPGASLMYIIYICPPIIGR